MIDFAPSPLGTLGVEFEGTLIDREHGLPRHIAQAVAEQVQPRLDRGVITPDFFESTLEFNTGVCTSIQEVRADLVNAWRATRPILDEHGARMLAMGVHPRASVAEMRLIEDPRYVDLMERLAWPGRRVFTTGIHVHVGMPSGDAALQAARRIRSTLPLLIALGAASPFRAGRCTGLASTRMAIFDALPRTGPLPDFDRWPDYEAYVDAMTRADAITSARDAWWDCRPQPRIGTLEIRVLDAIADLSDMGALVALAWCLVVGADSLGVFDLPAHLANENRWRAIRYGTRAEFIIDTAGATESVSRVGERLLDVLRPTAERMDCVAELDHCRVLASGRGAHQSLSIDPAAPAEVVSTRIDAAMRAMQVDW